MNFACERYQIHLLAPNYNIAQINILKAQKGKMQSLK